ncbi:MAG TPA: c-type cytochrome domain-containing protein, partial [Chitinophagales bacterium]|nr:c-type cytochrome domain-containing protein [Chitinophagales bacterium]
MRALLYTVLFSFSLTGCREEQRDYHGYPDEVGEIILSTCAVSGCHNDASKEAAGGLNLETWDKLFEGGNDNAVVIPYRPDHSIMLFFINTDSTAGPALQPTMPFNGNPLSAQQIQTIRDWIQQGAPDKSGFVKFSDNPARAKIYVCNQGCDIVAVLDLESRLIM